FVVYNTHADYFKPDVRLQLVDFLLQHAEESAVCYPTVIAGDFNTLPSHLPIVHPLTSLFDGHYVLQTLTKNHFRNAYDLALIAHAGPLSSFTVTNEIPRPFAGIMDFGILLDHIFITPSTIKVLFHAIDPATVDHHFPSDHLPVIADIAI